MHFLNSRGFHRSFVLGQLLVIGLGGLCCTSTRSEPNVHPEAGSSADISEECAQGLQQAQARFEGLQKLAPPFSVQTVLEPMNALWQVIDRYNNRSSLFANVHPDARVRSQAEACEKAFQRLVTDIELSKPLYEALSAIDSSGEDAVTQRYLKMVLRDFRRAGVDKSDDVRQQVRALKEELLVLGQQFAKNIRDDVRKVPLSGPEALRGLPEDYVEAHPVNEAGQVVITTDYPDYIPFMTYAQSDASRLLLYKAFRNRGYPANEEVLQNMLQKRNALAQLLGYAHWADYITEDKMIGSAQNAADFIEKISNLAEARAEQDLALLLDELHKSDPKAKKVGDWQKSFLSERIKKQKLSVDSQQVRQYFNYAKTKSGIFALTSQLFGVDFEPVDEQAWHEDVEVYRLLDRGEPIGKFYLDMHPREAKYKHAAAFPLVSGVLGVQSPAAALVCNFPKEGPMEHAQVETFFHEFGHLIHHLFGGKQRWLGVSGFHTEWDFVEAPSQMLEEWAWDADALKSFATDAQGKPIPAELVKAMNRARDFGQGLWVSHQMFYAALSLHYYNQNPEALDTTALMAKLQNRYSPFDYVDGTHMQYSFGHLDGYSAMYYTYMWSLVIAKDMHSRFVTEGMMSPKVAADYRRYVLEPGGSVPAATLVHNFLGRPYSFDAFGRWLNAHRR